MSAAYSLLWRGWSWKFQVCWDTCAYFLEVPFDYKELPGRGEWKWHLAIWHRLLNFMFYGQRVLLRIFFPILLWNQGFRRGTIAKNIKHSCGWCYSYVRNLNRAVTEEHVFDWWYEILRSISYLQSLLHSKIVWMSRSQTVLMRHQFKQHDHLCSTSQCVWKHPQLVCLSFIPLQPSVIISLPATSTSFICTR